MVDKYGTGDDPYTYPDSNVLTNLFEIMDAQVLEEAEKEFTVLAAAEISYKEPPYDFEYFCNLHMLLFGELFSWAGEVRSIDISKGDTRFCSCSFIEKEANKLFKNLAAENYLADTEYDDFIEKLAEYYCDINVLHPFREGNGRTQRMLFEHICINSGYNINFAGVSVDEWISANISGFHCDYTEMESILKRCVSLAATF